MPIIDVLPFRACYDSRRNETILAGALRAGRLLRYGRRHGGCGTCRVLLVDGEVEQAGSSFALPRADRADGWILACASAPAGDCVIDVSAGPDGMALTEEEFLAGDAVGTFVTEVAEITRLTRDVRGLRLRLLDLGSIRFTAGQFVTVEVPWTAATRAFLMASPPSESGSIDLVVRVPPGGAFSAALDERLAPGDRLRVSGPFGQLKVRLSHRPIIMIAGEDGCDGGLSHVELAPDRRPRRPHGYLPG